MDLYEVVVHICQSCFTGTGAIIWLPQCHWGNPEKYVYNRLIHNHDKSQQTENRAYISWDLLYITVHTVPRSVLYDGFVCNDPILACARRIIISTCYVYRIHMPHGASPLCRIIVYTCKCGIIYSLTLHYTWPLCQYTCDRSFKNGLRYALFVLGAGVCFGRR